jgi:general secretion pathway protein E
MQELQLRLATGQGRPIRLGDDPITIGRHPDNRLRLKDDKASRHHAIIEPATGPLGERMHRVRDLGSANGTKVNGERVGEALLAEGDVVRIGAVEFLVEARPDAGGNGAPATATVDAKAIARSNPRRELGAWAAELRELIAAQPGTGYADEPHQLVDARGESSHALGGTSEGPEAMRLMLRLAARARATGIHIEPKADAVHVRMRVDGQMIWIVEMPERTGELVIGLVKAACHMAQAGKDAAQDGHFSCRFSDRRVEYRASLTPSVHGQKLVVRVLDQMGAPAALEDMGLAPYMLDRIKSLCLQDTGMLLVCGPTGSGKTTTLYSALREIDREVRNVVTIEDPVEYQIDGVTQMPIDERKGNTLATLLRSVLRQDPDVILVGEIRDEETSRTAMQAAMTGHLVFSTVHARDTVSAVFRLLDLKVEPFLVASALQLVLAQRLVRVLCTQCKRPAQVPPGVATRMGRYLAGQTQIYHAVGCRRCLATGYNGRRAVFELLDVNDELRDIVLGQPSIQAMRRIIDQGLFTSLQQFGYRLVAEGATSLEEVDRVAGN